MENPYLAFVGCGAASQMTLVLYADGGPPTDLVVAPPAVSAYGSADRPLHGGVPAKDSLFSSGSDYRSLPSIYTT